MLCSDLCFADNLGLVQRTIARFRYHRKFVGGFGGLLEAGVWVSIFWQSDTNPHNNLSKTLRLRCREAEVGKKQQQQQSWQVQVPHMFGGGRTSPFLCSSATCLRVLTQPQDSRNKATKESRHRCHF